MRRETRVLARWAWRRPDTATAVRVGGRRVWRVETARCVRVALEWKWQDLWVGAFVKADAGRVHVWLTLVPTMPVHVTWSRPLRYYLEEPGEAFADAERVIAGNAL